MTTPDSPTPTPLPESRWDEHPDSPAFDPVAYQAQLAADQADLNSLARWWLFWCIASFLILATLCGLESFYVFMIANLGAESAAIRWFIWSQCAIDFFILLQAATGLFLYRALRKRLSLRLCIGLACITCLAFPFGTLLAFFTLQRLRRPSIARSFV